MVLSKAIKTSCILVALGLGEIATAGGSSLEDAGSVPCCEELRAQLARVLDRLGLDLENLSDRGGPTLAPNQVDSLLALVGDLQARLGRSDDSGEAEPDTCSCSILEEIRKYFKSEQVRRQQFLIGFESFESLCALFIGVLGLLIAIMALGGDKALTAMDRMSRTFLLDIWRIRIRAFWVWMPLFLAAILLTAADGVFRALSDVEPGVTTWAAVCWIGFAFVTYPLMLGMLYRMSRENQEDILEHYNEMP